MGISFVSKNRTLLNTTLQHSTRLQEALQEDGDEPDLDLGQELAYEPYTEPEQPLEMVLDNLDVLSRTGGTGDTQEVQEDRPATSNRSRFTQNETQSLVTLLNTPHLNQNSEGIYSFFKKQARLN